MHSTQSLTPFFQPHSIAIIGATDNPKKIGYAITKNILENPKGNYKISLVSYKKGEILGHLAVSSILDLNQTIDLAIVLVPARFVESIISECIKKKVKSIIIVTAGFGEMGISGKNVQNRIAKQVHEANIRLIGPNCVGIQNISFGLNASFIQKPLAGGISMITQSGSIGAACIWEFNAQDMGMAKFTNLGNAADVQFYEILEYYSSDPETQVIAIYLESLQEGRQFYEMLQKVTRKKPVIILKGGTSTKGMQAAQSHTGSLSSNFSVFQAMVHQAGGILCDTLDEFITALKTFSYVPLPQGAKIAVVTGSGGSSVLFSDYAERFGFHFAIFSPELEKELGSHLIELVKMENPLDMIASADENTFYHVTKTLLASPEIDIIVPCSLVPPFLEQEPQSHMRGVLHAWQETGQKKPIIPLMVYGEMFPELQTLRRTHRFPLFFTPKEAATAVKYLLIRFKYLNRISRH